MLWEHELQGSVSTAFSSSPPARVPAAFLVLRSFHKCLYNSIETRCACFLFVLENTATRKKENNLLTVIIKM